MTGLFLASCRYGSWGLIEYTGQPAAAAPKYQAVKGLLDAKQPAGVYSGCLGPQQGAGGLGDGSFFGMPSITFPAKSAVLIQVRLHSTVHLITPIHLLPTIKNIVLYLVCFQAAPKYDEFGASWQTGNVTDAPVSAATDDFFVLTCRAWITTSLGRHRMLPPTT